MKVDVWSDVVCPWCYIGKRHLEQALARFEHADDVDVVWHSFQLDPDAPVGGGGPVAEALAVKYGLGVREVAQMQRRVTDVAAAAGLEYRLDGTLQGNTLDAHRLLHHARAHGLGGALKERLLSAYFTEGESLFDHDSLTRLAVETGLEADAVRAVLGSDDFARDVADDLATARAYGITGVPFFVVDGKVGVSGAQPADVLHSALVQGWAMSHPVTVLAGGGSADGASCEGDACAR